ncbi:MAG: cytochrome C4 [Thalassospira sp.]|nr:cytochrome C4 [Thalassospira sp.]|tara:strand:- start:230 stop:574 length:345 start_codon:yes stop_codon:yes gene_type:complete
MMMRSFAHTASFTAAIMIAWSAFSVTDAKADDAKPDAMPTAASQCLSCHGTNGNPALKDVPILLGQQPLYLENAIRAYQEGRRTGGQALVMHEIVKDLSNADIKAIATWFGGTQ